ncbi:MAG: DNRLRE domain-containing protein [Desulfobacterales bacterium]|nr:DNRLRE domain-containing protein [Desulfobacterales bacterium]
MYKMKGYHGKPIAVFMIFFAVSLASIGGAFAAEPLIIDHNHTNIREIPEAAIIQAKETLHIAYGHTSHGSQLTSGMGSSSGAQLDAFMTNNGATPGLYTWNNGGSGGALDLHNYFVSGDLGNPDRYTWAQRTRDYLDNPANSDVNVIIWSWCGQAATSISNIDIYLNLMEGLIADYPDVHFVFMTGHLNGGGANGQLNLANEHIRNHCRTHGRILYDFADIESYDPDGQANYMELSANDNCDYDSDGNGSRDRNWAVEWQNSHVEGVDWWASGAAHSQHLNGNRKGYAAWWLWASLAGYNTCIEAPSNLNAQADSVNGEVVLTWTDNSSDVNEDAFIIQRRVDGGAWDDLYDSVQADGVAYTDAGLAAGAYSYRVVSRLDDDGSGAPCHSGPSNTADGVIVNADPPAAPSALTASGDDMARAIALAWSDHSNNEAQFIVQRRKDADPWDDAYQTLPANTVSFTDENLAPGSYLYRVTAVNEYGASSPSNEAGCVILHIPAAPAGLEARGDSATGTASLTWTDNSDGESGFTIQRQVDGGAWDESYDAVDADVTSYVDDNKGAPPLPNGTYNYRVTAFNANGVSYPSNEDSAVISSSAPEAPLNLDSVLNGFDVSLTWIDNSDNEEGFILERKVDDGSFTVLAELPADAEAFADPGLAPLHEYAYRVKAVNNFGDSGYSNEVSEYIAEASYAITLKQGVNDYAGCRDAYLDNAHPDVNYGATQYKYVLDDPKCNFAISFELPAEVMNKKILDARLTFYCWSVSGYTENQHLDLYGISEAWDEDAATWSERMDGVAWGAGGGTHDPEPLDRFLIPPGSHHPDFDVTDLVQEWSDGVSANLGVLLKNDSLTDTGIKGSEYSEYGRPFLEITYTTPPACVVDSDNDGDVDGLDLAAFAMNYDETCLEEFAEAFGQ